MVASLIFHQDDSFGEDVIAGTYLPVEKWESILTWKRKYKVADLITKAEIPVKAVDPKELITLSASVDIVPNCDPNLTTYLAQNKVEVDHRHEKKYLQIGINMI